MHTKLAAVVAALLLLSPLPLAAQNAAPPARIRGTIESVSKTSLSIKARDGSTVTVALVAPVTVGTVVRARLADIKPGDFVGSAAMKGKDGKLHALEVHIFPEAMRGTGEGQRPWDAGPGSSMTNATVGEVMATPSGHSLKLVYKGGIAEIEVAANTPIVALAPGNWHMVRPGKAVILFATKRADGSLSTSRVTVESKGVRPPM